jgi:hypothetical protein
MDEDEMLDYMIKGINDTQRLENEKWFLDMESEFDRKTIEYRRGD